jgi:hypothetical protein
MKRYSFGKFVLDIPDGHKIRDSDSERLRPFFWDCHAKI